MFPSKSYRTTLKKGITKGHDVWALQINLNDWSSTSPLVEDGVFGDGTEARVRRFQREHNLVVDGVAGLITQLNLGLVLSERASLKYNLPAGLLRGITEGESGWAVGAVNWSVAGGVDCGYVQRRVYSSDYSDAAFHKAFSGAVQFPLTASELRSTKGSFFGMPGATTQQRAWELAVLNHNWPFAAKNYASGLKNWSYTAYDENGVKRSYKMTDPAWWVERIGVPNVSTGEQWAKHYITSKTAYVTSWPA